MNGNSKISLKAKNLENRILSPNLSPGISNINYFSENQISNFNQKGALSNDMLSLKFSKKSNNTDFNFNLEDFKKKNIKEKRSCSKEILDKSLQNLSKYTSNINKTKNDLSLNNLCNKFIRSNSIKKDERHLSGNFTNEYNKTMNYLDNIKNYNSNYKLDFKNFNEKLDSKSNINTLGNKYNDFLSNTLNSKKNRKDLDSYFSPNISNKNKKKKAMFEKLSIEMDKKPETKNEKNFKDKIQNFNDEFFPEKNHYNNHGKILTNLLPSQYDQYFLKTNGASFRERNPNFGTFLNLKAENLIKKRGGEKLISDYGTKNNNNSNVLCSNNLKLNYFSNNNSRAVGLTKKSEKNYKTNIADFMKEFNLEFDKKNKIIEHEKKKPVLDF